MITLKKVTILALHLGYGGIEKSIAALANLLADDYEVEIISSYQLFDKPAFDIDPRVEVRYLITKYKPNREAWKSSIKHLRPISFVKESFNSVMTLALRRSTMIRAIENCHSDIIISTRDLFNTWLGTYGRKSCYKIGWEHNHYHGDMSYADKVFIDMCRDILDNGTSTEGEKVRPVWEDGTSAYTIKKFGVVNRYDLSKEFPALTLRRTAIKSCVDELLWIWQKKSNNVHELKSHIWDSWADENGSIGKAYGYQMGVKHQYKEGMMDQVDRVIYDLKNNPYSRRIMTNIYVHQDLHEMNLYPCAYSMTFNVTKEKDSDVLTLNGILNQRSQDVLTANNWNVCQYAVLIYMLAQVCGMKAGEFVHVIADAHIYDRHVPMIEELIAREPLPAPKFWLNPEITDFYAFTPDDVRLDDYETHPQIKNIPVAV